jgi:topoisomerase IV subunit B
VRTEGSEIPAEDTIHFPEGLKDFLQQQLEGRETVTSQPFAGEADLGDKKGRIEWAITWPLDQEPYLSTYCNTIPTPEGGTHEAGLRSGILRSIKAYGELVGNKKTAQIMAEDVLGGSVAILSLFMRDPQFQGQTKNKLVSVEASRLVENAIKDHFDHWLAASPEIGNRLLAYVIERSDERIRRKNEKDVSRKAVTQKLRLPGKLADCTRSSRQGTELFIVEGDSAGGSAKQARSRETQAILPLRGKILNVASASLDKIKANQELSDLVMALGCGSGQHFSLSSLRYDKIIIMTDADVDGAHIASLLMTFFYQEMPELIRAGHLYLAQPPLYRITHGTVTHYAQNDKAKDKLVEQLSKKPGKIEIGRFKGLGEMTPAQLKETTMEGKDRVLLKVTIVEDEQDATRDSVERLMGKKPEHRFAFISEQTQLRGAEVLEQLDV